MIDAEIIEHLPGDLRRIAEVIGIENTLSLAREFRGLWLYMHSLDDLEREIRNNKIKAAFDAMTADDRTAIDAVECLALKHKLTTRQIWNILKSEPEAPAPTPLLDLIK